MDYLINTNNINNDIINIFSELNFNVDIFKNECKNLEKKIVKTIKNMNIIMMMN